jgi:hypothetical protein
MATKKTATPRKPGDKAAKTVAKPAAKVAARKTPEVAPSKPKTILLAPEPKSPAKVKTKLVRDSFTIPKSEYAVLEALKKRALRLACPAKKSEILRAGIGILNGLTDQAFFAAIDAVPNLKTGRPKKN